MDLEGPEPRLFRVQEVKIFADPSLTLTAPAGEIHVENEGQSGEIIRLVLSSSFSWRGVIVQNMHKKHKVF